MDWYPLMNAVRIAVIATLAAAVPAIPAAYYAARLPQTARIVPDILLTLPLVLPPTVLGLWLWSAGRPLVNSWQAGIFASALAALPLLYRGARGAFDRFDEDLAGAARTLGRSNVWTFWMVRVPVCGRGLAAGVVLGFARAIGEFGITYMAAGYTPGRSATLSTTIFDLWRQRGGDGAGVWVLASLCLSGAALLCLSALESADRRKGGRGGWN